MPVGFVLTVIVGLLIFTALLVTHGDPDLWGTCATDSTSSRPGRCRA